MKSNQKPTVSPLPAGPVIVTEHARPEAAMLRFWAQMVEESFFGLRSPQCATELRAAAERLTCMERAMRHVLADIDDCQQDDHCKYYGEWLRDALAPPLPREAPGTET